MTALPNLLTMSRIAAIPLIVILLYFDAPHWRWLALGLFAAACITDFFDGYLAAAASRSPISAAFSIPSPTSCSLPP